LLSVSVYPPPRNKPEQWSQKRRPLLGNIPAATNARSNRRTAGRGRFDAVLVISNTQYVVKGKQAVSCLQISFTLSFNEAVRIETM
jgi:hypothetical protein